MGMSKNKESRNWFKICKLAIWSTTAVTSITKTSSIGETGLTVGHCPKNSCDLTLTTSGVGRHWWTPNRACCQPLFAVPTFEGYR
jgi:hypothetical protein